jgi:tRNA threonylcarbamoyladenosine biosynthesis protein TsaB
MALFLCLETSTTVCSVALFDNNQLLQVNEVNNGYTHAENLHVFIQEVLNKSEVKPRDLSAIAVGKGPGSYTGLRIGVSAAKGMAYALSIPLISMNSLQNMVAGLKNEFDTAHSVFVPMLDARRMEVYMGIYDKNGNEIESTSSFIINEGSLKEKFSTYKKVYLLGDGAEKCRDFIHSIPHAEIIPQQMPSALNMGDFCIHAFQHKQFENTAYFEPFYLKEFFTGK